MYNSSLVTEVQWKWIWNWCLGYVELNENEHQIELDQNLMWPYDQVCCYPMANGPKDFLPCLKHIHIDPQPKLRKMQRYPQMILNNLSTKFCRHGDGVTWWADMDKSVIVQIFVNIQIRIDGINTLVANYFTIISHGFIVITRKIIDWTVLLKMLRKAVNKNGRLGIPITWNKYICTRSSSTSLKTKS